MNFEDFLVCSPNTDSQLFFGNQPTHQKTSLDSDGFRLPAPKSKKPQLQITTDNLVQTKPGKKTPSFARMSPGLGSPVTPTSPSIGVFIDSPRGSKGYGGFYISPRLASPSVSPFKNVDPNNLFSQAFRIKQEKKESMQSVHPQEIVEVPKKQGVKREYPISPVTEQVSVGGFCGDVVQREVKLDRRVVLGKWKKKLKQSLEPVPLVRASGGKTGPSLSGKQGPPLVPKQATPERFATVLTANDFEDDKIQAAVGLSDEVETLLKGFVFSDSANVQPIAPPMQPVQPAYSYQQQVDYFDVSNLTDSFMPQQPQYVAEPAMDWTNYDWALPQSQPQPYHHHPQSVAPTMLQPQQQQMQQQHYQQQHQTLQMNQSSIPVDDSLAQKLTNIVQSMGTDKFNCPFPDCAHEFSRRHDLLRHLRIHTQEKPYRCDKCFKAFTRLDALKRHVQVSDKYGGQCRIKRGRVPKSVSTNI